MTRSILNEKEGFQNKELDENKEHVRKCEDGVLIASEYVKMLKSKRNSIIRIVRRNSIIRIVSKQG